MGAGMRGVHPTDQLVLKLLVGITMVLAVIVMTGCSTQFQYMDKKHTIPYTADLLSQIQHDACQMTREDRHIFLSRINRNIEVGHLSMSCGLGGW